MYIHIYICVCVYNVCVLVQMFICPIYNVCMCVVVCVCVSIYMCIPAHE
jgi:hypothetical protein